MQQDWYSQDVQQLFSMLSTLQKDVLELRHENWHLKKNQHDVSLRQQSTEQHISEVQNQVQGLCIEMRSCSERRSEAESLTVWQGGELSSMADWLDRSEEE